MRKLSTVRVDTNNAPSQLVRTRKLSYLSNRPAEIGVPRKLLQVGIILILVAYFYSLYSKNRTKHVYTIEETVLQSLNRVIEVPAVQFRKIVIGFNGNVDLIVPGASLLNRLNVSADREADHASIDTEEALFETFFHFFRQGIAAERYTTDRDVFDFLVKVAEDMQDSMWAVGGNAAIMAQRLASSYSKAKIYLVGPIGPRLRTLFHPNVRIQNQTIISKDELHLIMEYKQGEIIGDYVCPTSNRFITSHDTISSSLLLVEMFFNVVATHKPELVIFSGLHLLHHQPREWWMDKLTMIKRNLIQMNPLLPTHLEIGSFTNVEFAKHLVHRIIAFTDSIGLNEQELVFLSHAAGGPHGGLYPMSATTLPVHKAVDILHWLITTFGKDKTNPDSKKVDFRLQRIHFRSLTYHILVTRGPDWSNSPAALAVGAKLAGSVGCGGVGATNVDPGSVELRIAKRFVLDTLEDRKYEFDANNPMTSWMRGSVLFMFAPSLICKHPHKTVGLGDIVSSTALMYSAYYRFDK